MLNFISYLLDTRELCLMNSAIVERFVSVFELYFPNE